MFQQIRQRVLFKTNNIMNQLLTSAFAAFFNVAASEIILTDKGKYYEIDLPKNGMFAVTGYIIIERVYKKKYQDRVVLKMEKVDLWYIFQN